MSFWPNSHGTVRGIGRMSNTLPGREPWTVVGSKSGSRRNCAHTFSTRSANRSRSSSGWLSSSGKRASERPHLALSASPGSAWPRPPPRCDRGSRRRGGRAGRRRAPLPAFFAFSGMRTQIQLVSGSTNWLLCLLIILLACVGKFGGSAIAARISCLPWRDSSALGILMNTRGLVELIVLNVGLDFGVISPNPRDCAPQGRDLPSGACRGRRSWPQRVMDWRSLELTYRTAWIRTCSKSRYCPSRPGE